MATGDVVERAVCGGHPGLCGLSERRGGVAVIVFVGFGGIVDGHGGRAPAIRKAEEAHGDGLVLIVGQRTLRRVVKGSCDGSWNRNVDAGNARSIRGLDGAKGGSVRVLTGREYFPRRFTCGGEWIISTEEILILDVGHVARGILDGHAVIER